MNNKNVNAEKWQDWDVAFDYFNQALFEGRLSPCFIHIAHQATVYGIFKPNSYEDSDGNIYHTIRFNPEIESLSPLEKMGFLVNQMIHQWCWQSSGNETKNYCSEAFKEKAKEIGLTPLDISDTNKKKNYSLNFAIEKHGKFNFKALTLLTKTPNHFLKKIMLVDGDAELDDSAKPTNKKATYRCPQCGLQVWGKPGITSLLCSCSNSKGTRLKEV